MKQLVHRVLALLCVALSVSFALLALPVQGAIIFSEDFESYADNSNLAGQGGWTGDETRVALGNNLPTQVSNGRIDPGTGILALTFHDFSVPLSSGSIYTLSFDAYAQSTGVYSHNSGVYFTDPSGAGVLRAGWFMTTSPSQADWVFDVRGLTGNPVSTDVFSEGFDTRVELQVILDPLTNAVYGRANFGSGFIETAHFPMTESQFGIIDGVVIHQEYRGASRNAFLGAEFDNLLVESHTPPPSGPTCNGLAATLVGTDGPETLVGTPDDDVIVGLGGNDILRGMQGNDTLCGGDGDDLLRGGSGDDTIFGEGDKDVVSAGNDNDSVDGGPGNDQLHGGGGNDMLFGGGGDDELVGAAGDDVLDGGPGSDTCTTDSEDTAQPVSCEM